MLARHMLGYMPSLVVSALLAFASVTLFTCEMSQDGYGHYILAINAMTMLVSVGFYWLHSAASRLLPQAVHQGRETALMATLYGVFACCAVVLLALAFLGAEIFSLGDWRIAAWFAPPMAVLRALLTLNQCLHRNFVRISRYNFLEIGQSALGLGAAYALIVYAHRGASGAALGGLMGLAAMALVDWPMLARVQWRAFDRGMFKEIAAFGLPFVVTNAMAFILSRSDSFLIQAFQDSAAVGVYGAGYAFPDRIGQNLFMAVATASFPLTVRRLEQEGIEAARDQTFINGIAIFALAIPAGVGLLIVHNHLAAVLIGENFREGAARVMPWIAVATIFAGLADHYFNHAFHLAKKTHWLIYVQLPAAALNLIANLMVIPRYGYMGAAYTTLASYTLYLALSILVGRRAFPIKFPFVPVIQIAAASAAMAVALNLFSFPQNIAGLALMVLGGGAVYAAAFWALDIGGVRRVFGSRLRDHLARPPRARFSFSILTDFDDIEALAPEWAALHQERRQSLFGSYRWMRLWWQHLGRSGKARWYVAIARDAQGALVAVLPLALRQSGGFALMEWAGYDVFDFGDILARDADTASALWHFARHSRLYDIALIKDVHAQALSLPILTQGMQRRETRRNYFLTLAFSSGEAWLASQSRKLRGDVRRKTEKMAASGGAVYFDVLAKGDALPLSVVDALYAQKAVWFKERRASGVFARPEVAAFLRDLAKDAADQGVLYLAWLTCGETIVACHMGFVYGGALHLYHTTYDAAFGAYSPGNAMMVETIQWAIDAGLRELDFMRGDESYKQRFASGARDLTAFVYGRSLPGKFAVWARGQRMSRAENDDKDAITKSNKDA